MYHYLRTNRPLFFIIIISFEKSKRKEGIKNRMTVHSRNNNNNKLECFTFIDQGITRVRKRRKTWRAWRIARWTMTRSTAPLSSWKRRRARWTRTTGSIGQRCARNGHPRKTIYASSTAFHNLTATRSRNRTWTRARAAPVTYSKATWTSWTRATEAPWLARTRTAVKLSGRRRNVIEKLKRKSLEPSRYIYILKIWRWI